MNKIARITALFFFVSLILFLFGSLTKLEVPLGEWDRVSLQAAENWSKGVNKAWIFDHPPLYPFFLSIIFKFFGAGVMTARLGNILCVLLTALVLFHFTSRLFNHDAALLAVVFYFSSPITIQGTSSMDVADTSLLPLAFMLTANSLRNNTVHPGLKNTTILSLLIGLCFWAKVTSSIALIIPLLIGSVAYVVLGINKDQKPWLLNIVGIIVGIGLFLLTWISLSRLLWGSDAFSQILATPWTAIHPTFDQSAYFARLLSRGYDAFRVLIWFSPYFVMMWLCVSWDMAKDKSKLSVSEGSLINVFVWTALFYFVGYAAVGGTNWGFPRYHAAILPLVCAFVGYYVSNVMTNMDRKTMMSVLGCVFVVVVVVIAFLNDPLLFLNLRFEEMLLYNNSIESIVKEFLITVLPYYGLPIVCWLILNRYLKRDTRVTVGAICLYIGALTSIVSLDIQQAVAGYRTTSQYGAVDKGEVIQRVRSHVKEGDYVIGTPEFSYDLKYRELSGTGWDVWKSKDRLYESVISNKPQAIIAGLTINTYAQLKWLFSKDMQLFLSNNYRFNRIGTYYLWLRSSKSDRNTDVGSSAAN